MAAARSLPCEYWRPLLARHTLELRREPSIRQRKTPMVGAQGWSETWVPPRDLERNAGPPREPLPPEKRRRRARAGRDRSGAGEQNARGGEEKPWNNVEPSSRRSGSSSHPESSPNRRGAQ